MTLSKTEVLFLLINTPNYLQITKPQWKRREKVLTKVLTKAMIKVLIKALTKVLTKAKQNQINHFCQWNLLWNKKNLTKIFSQNIECPNKLNHKKVIILIYQDSKNHQVPIELLVLLLKVSEALSSKGLLTIVLFLLHLES